MTLYMVKVVEKSGVPVAYYLSDDHEWEKMKNVIKQMLEEIINKQVICFEDIRVGNDFEIQVENARNFKLLATLVETLSVEEQTESEKSNIDLGSLTESQNRIINQYTVKEKIETIEQLKQTYSIKEKKDTCFTKIDEIELLDVSPIIDFSQKEIFSVQDQPGPDLNSIDTNLQEEFEHTMVDSALYRRLQEENEALKKQLLQYQVKYETLKSLLKTE